MNNKKAKELGRWCETHRRRYKRTALPNGAVVTGCPVCAFEPGFIRCVDRLIEARAKGEA